MPIEVFDFTGWHMSSDVPMDTEMLEEIPGLKVVWREEDNRLRDYICGVGDPRSWMRSVILPGEIPFSVISRLCKSAR